MKTICYLVPYFGKLPKGFEMWLLSCKTNASVDWILFIDDRTEYDYPPNVKVRYCSFDDIQNRIRSWFNFDIVVNRPWKLCEFRPAYGEIFAEELQGYDFWGHCDIDLIWGNIRKFITNDILEKYEKIGFQGHSTLYKNTKEINARYKISVDGIINYEQAFTSGEGFCFDEEGMNSIYKFQGIPFYHETNFAHLDRFTNSFFLGHLREEDNYKNRRQVFAWENGGLYRYYAFEGQLHKEEYMYLHLFSRPISFQIDHYNSLEMYVVYPDVVKRFDQNKLTYSFVERKGKCSAMRFYAKVAWFNRHKITLKKVIYNFRKKANLVTKRGYA